MTDYGRNPSDKSYRTRRVVHEHTLDKDAASEIPTSIRAALITPVERAPMTADQWREELAVSVKAHDRAARVHEALSEFERRRSSGVATA